MAARPGFEPGSEDPKSPVLPLHHRAELARRARSESGRWRAQTVSIGAEGRSRTDTGLPPTVFETVASANSATSAAATLAPSRAPGQGWARVGIAGAEDEGRTRDLLLGKEALYH